MSTKKKTTTKVKKKSKQIKTAKIKTLTTKVKSAKKTSNSVMAKWGSKKWKVSKKMILPIENASLNMSYDTEKKKKEKRTCTIPYNIYLEFGVDVKKEIDFWYKNLGKNNPLYLGKTRFGSNKMKLTGADVTEVATTQNGTIRSASISLSFEEVKESKKKAPKKKTVRRGTVKQLNIVKK
ncbi:MAG: hypothetical protein K2N51_18130 [Lachnospiraceae bacterium]|nr:hypothetical protein [Lachnospiraceae bacterium]